MNLFFIDGYINCKDGSDEAPSQCPSCHATGEFKCSNNRCIPLSLRCNHVDDCADNSDEDPLLCGMIHKFFSRLWKLIFRKLNLFFSNNWA